MRDIKKWRLVDDVSPLFNENNKRVSKIYRNKFVNTENKHILWDVLVFRIVKYFNPLLVFWLALRALQNTVQLVKILSDTTHQNVS